MAIDVETYGLRDICAFSTKLVKFYKLPNGLIRVHLELQPCPECSCCTEYYNSFLSTNADPTTKTFSSHVRTGTHSIHNSAIKYPGESDFSGKIVGGIEMDIAVNQFTDKDVVIVGLGAFGV